MDLDWKILTIYALPIMCVVAVIGMVTLCTLSIHEDTKVQEELRTEVIDKIADGYTVRIDGIEVGNPEIKLFLDNFRMYVVAIDNENRVIAVTKKMSRAVGFPVTVPVTFR